MRDDVIRNSFEILDKSLRAASLARIGGFAPTNHQVSSWFGGGFVGNEGDDWPEFAGEWAVPLLQVRCDELPYVPDQLKDVALLNIFICAQEPPTDLPAPNGKNWLIRTYPHIEGLVSLDSPLDALPVHTVPVRWTRSDKEAPGWEDAWSVADLSEFNRLPDAVDLFFERYATHPFTKVGGWPSYIRGTNGESERFVLQITSEEKPRWTFKENGNIYVYRKDDDWLLHWDSY